MQPMELSHHKSSGNAVEAVVKWLSRLPREPSKVCDGLRRVAAIVLRGWLKLYHRLEIDGRENLPADGSCVLVANHSSHLDTLCLLAALPLRKLNRTFPAAAADYFFASVTRMVVAVVVVNALPFYRRQHLKQSLEMCRRLLASKGNILILYPQGTRSSEGRIEAFKPGVGSLLAGTNISVIPCLLEGGEGALPQCA